jgi:hypothetical protein
VVKGGAIVHEKYFANSSDTKYETDSAAKTMIAALIGAVHRHRPWDIDRPIVEYVVDSDERRERSLISLYCMLYVLLLCVLPGLWFVRRLYSILITLSSFLLPSSSFLRYGVETDIYGAWANVVTTRHIVSQTSGQGRIPPGVAMTYDSDAFIQKLSPLMGKILAKDNMTVLDWAERYFAKPLGTPLYTFMHLYSRTHTCVTPIIHVYTPIYTPDTPLNTLRTPYIRPNTRPIYITACP